MNKADVLIVGGGIVGLSAALAMHQRGFSVVILEKNSMPQQASLDASRVYAINQASQQLLTQIGVWSRLDAAQLAPYCHMHIWDAESGAKIDFDARMVLTDHLGFMIEESFLKNTLLAYVMEQDISIISGYHVKQVTQATDDQCIQVTDGHEIWSAELLIAADGAHSQVREHLKVPLTSWSYHQQAIVATVRTEHSHQQTAYQVFHPDGPLALLPMANEHHCSIVWSTTPKETTRLLTLCPEDFNTAIMQAFGSTLGSIELVTSRYHFPLHMRHAQQYAGSGWILMGDAAHTIHPLAGLGLNVGFADLAAWLQVVERKRAGSGWLQRHFAQYQRQRKAALWQMIIVMEALHRLFKNTIPLIMSWRALGLNMTDRLVPLKRLLIEYAAGTR